MSSRKVWVSKGVYDNSATQRRERYDGGGNVIESAGIQWLVANNRPKFGTYPDIPEESVASK